MSSVRQLSLILPGCLVIYVVISVFLRRDAMMQHLPAVFRYSNHRINSTAAVRTDHANGILIHGSRHYPTSPTTVPSFAGGPVEPTSCVRRVQFWNYPHQSNLTEYLERRYYCPATDCTIEYMHSSSYDVMRSSDVIVLHHIGDWKIATINRIRRPDQIIAVMTRETPMHSSGMEHLGSFNWTITYNSRSDIPIPYGWYERNPPTDEMNTTQLRTKNWALGKTGLAIWIVSNCKEPSWPRFEYVKTLAKYMKIDIFGACGEPCGDKESCHKRIYAYKFYIAFENSLCEDYITEKFWKNGLQHDAVPIVYGAPKSDYARLAPNNSFIHISDFSNMSSLAAYIDSLDRNDSLYNMYFEWKLVHHVRFRYIFEAAGSKVTLCHISKRLVEGVDGSNVSDYRDAVWFRKSCPHVPRPKMV